MESFTSGSFISVTEMQLGACHSELNSNALLL
jgi:hypothetical protein